MDIRKFWWPLLMLLLVLRTPTVFAEEPEEDSLGLNLELSLQSAFMFRGYNIFQENGQRDLNMLLAPGVTWAVPDTGWSLAYWGAFQVSGGNISELIKAGVGAEQDLIFIYERKLGDLLSLEASLCWYLFPFADEDVAGSTFPVFVEPLLKFKWAAQVDFSLAFSYFFGLQDIEGIRDFSHLYVRPALTKGFALTEWLGMEMSLGYGFKVMIEGNEGYDNIHDVDLALTLPVSLPHGLYLLPSLHVGWSDLAEAELSETVLVWGGVVVGVDL
ncbi:MAG: hypothetical protein JRF33_19935 [Deltaproteobacteria bacterium]|nr:hypothetical protein [Deltaproteobacteria bacterium]